MRPIDAMPHLETILIVLTLCVAIARLSSSLLRAMTSIVEETSALIDSLERVWRQIRAVRRQRRHSS